MVDIAPSKIKLPKSLEGVELVRSVRTPARLDYTYTAGLATTRFLNGIGARKILGERAPGGKVYVPSRGADPQLGVATSEQVEVAHVGTLTSYCIVNVAFHGQGMEIPYTSGLILLDGSDLPIMHLIQECPVTDVHIGMRVEAVWVDDAELGPTLARMPGSPKRRSGSRARDRPTTSQARRSASCRPLTASDRGRRSRRAMSRWTGRGRSTRPG